MFIPCAYLIIIIAISVSLSCLLSREDVFSTLVFLRNHELLNGLTLLFSSAADLHVTMHLEVRRARAAGKPQRSHRPSSCYYGKGMGKGRENG